MHPCLLKLTIDLWLSVKATECLGYRGGSRILNHCRCRCFLRRRKSSSQQHRHHLVLFRWYHHLQARHPPILRKSHVSHGFFARLATSLVYLDSTIPRNCPPTILKNILACLTSQIKVPTSVPPQPL